jgi:hypothetical protein
LSIHRELRPANGGTLTINGPSDEVVSFAGGAGTLHLTQPSTFKGEIAGISGRGDIIDFGSLQSKPSDGFQTSSIYYSASNTTALTVTDTADKMAASVILAGNYTKSNGIEWMAKSDGNGGADVSEVSLVGVQHSQHGSDFHLT